MKLKKRAKCISLIIAAVMTLSSLISNVTVNAEPKQEKSAMQTYVEAMQPGWNLGNTFEATGSETSWGNPTTTKALIDGIAANGYKSIRIPITWKHRMGDAPDYIIQEEFMNRIEEVVDWSLDAGLHVMINLHHDTGWVMGMATEHDDVLARFNAAWTQISRHFKDYPQTLMFESINEPRFSEDWNKDMPEYFAMLNELNTSFHEIVRKSGGKNAERPLVLPTLTASPSPNRLAELDKTISQWNDHNLIATFHYYGFWPFSVNVGGSTTFNDAVKDDMEQAFGRAYDTFRAKGIPVIVGEYGLLGFDKSIGTVEHGEVLKYFEYISYLAKEKGFASMLWDNGQHFQRRLLEWGDPELYNVMKVGLNGRSSYAQTDSIYIKKDKAVEDVIIPLVLNGNTFVDIKSGDKTLVKGTDYEVSGDKMTIKASLLETLVTKEYGMNAALTCVFSAGADWKLNVIYYDTPRLKSTEGIDAAFSIPTQFNGDSLATMEAVYTSGGNAGPQDWSSFKEFNYAFSPSYDSSEIKLTKELFQEMKDGEVKLNLHFWSGEVVPYTLTKKQSQITGVSSFEPEAEKENAIENTPQGTESPTTAPVQVVEGQAKAEEDSTALTFIWSGVAACALLIIGIGAYRKKGKTRDRQDTM